MVVIIPPPRPPPDPDPGPRPTDPTDRPSRPRKMTNKNLHLSSPILAGHPCKNTPYEHFEVDIFHFFARLRRAGRIGRTRPRAPTNLLISATGVWAYDLATYGEFWRVEGRSTRGSASARRGSW